MCEPVTLGMLLTGAGSAASAVNRQQALRRQDRAAAAGLRRQATLQREAMAETDRHRQQLAASDGQAERDAMMDAFLQALAAADEGGGVRRPVAADPRFVADVVTRGALTEALSDARADRAATLTGAAVQRQTEARSRAQLADALAELGRQSQAADALTRLRVSERQPNPWVDALAQIAGGVGGTLGTRGRPPRSPDLRRRYRAGTLIDPPTTPYGPGRLG